jgi:hypothetical protein
VLFCNSATERQAARFAGDEVDDSSGFAHFGQNCIESGLRMPAPPGRRFVDSGSAGMGERIRAHSIATGPKLRLPGCLRHSDNRSILEGGSQSPF